jgi:hypothetical protein
MGQSERVPVGSEDVYRRDHIRGPGRAEVGAGARLPVECEERVACTLLRAGT